MADASLAVQKQQAVQLTVAVFNSCHYCTAAGPRRPPIQLRQTCGVGKGSARECAPCGIGASTYVPGTFETAPLDLPLICELLTDEEYAELLRRMVQVCGPLLDYKQVFAKQELKAPNAA